eukprot:TRINITY_DN10795_c1_g2_i2.p1 TRINITY_DN10795_c1_g2~~TRINITY_DN10795_c1_g2_i2.p1  ORF type:complete len:313 (+),score=64.83 TRINITY_DN10795_c1_g2_i2:94-939(+)
MHGILGTAEKMEPVVGWIQDAVPGTYVTAIEVGNGALDSLFMDMNRQVELFCEAIYNDTRLSEGFNLIGFSQGGLVARGYLQRCNKFPVINFISWASPQGGQFGGAEFLVPAFISVVLGRLPYEPDVQKSLSLAQYWRDSYDLKQFESNSTFLADLNNVRPQKNEQYRTNIKSLRGMMLLHSTKDQIINPPSSGWFQSFLPFTGPGKNGIVVPLRQSALYKEDWLGLKTLDESGRLQMHTSECQHEEHPTPSCKQSFDAYTLPLLRQSWADVRAWRSSHKP